MVPAGAEVHGVLLSSSSLRSRHDLSTAEFSNGIPVARNARAASCVGGRKALPLQGEEVDDAVPLRYEHRAGGFAACNSVAASNLQKLKIILHQHPSSTRQPVAALLTFAVGGDCSLPPSSHVTPIMLRFRHEQQAIPRARV